MANVFSKTVTGGLAAGALLMASAAVRVEAAPAVQAAVVNADATHTAPAIQDVRFCRYHWHGCFAHRVWRHRGWHYY